MLQRGLMESRINAAHDAPSTDADTHPSVHHKRNAAEHLLFLNISGAEGRTHAIYQSVIGGSFSHDSYLPAGA
jgi:hypothetical protein